MTLDSLSKPKEFLQNFLLAGTISAFSKTLVAPLENTILHASIFNQNTTSYLTRTIKEQGILALWRRNLTNLRRYSPHQALNFAFYDLFKMSFNPKMEFWRFLLSHMVAGAAAGGLTSLILYLRDWSKPSKIQLASNYGKSNGFTKDGILNLYKGFSITVVGVMVYRSVYFGGYEAAKKMISPQWREKSFVEKYLVAFGVANFAVLLSNPVDIVRRKMVIKLANSRSENVQFLSALDFAKRIYREEGLKAFVKGSRANWVSGIVASLNLVLYDELKALLFENNQIGSAI